MTGLLAILLLLPRTQSDSLFEDVVAPLFESKCLKCHNDETAKGGLSLATRSVAMEGGESGPALEPGDARASLIIEKVAGPRPSMPKGAAPLAEEEVAAIGRWIDAGAEWPAQRVLTAQTREAGFWWAIQPLRRPLVPAPEDAGWSRTPIDKFILKQLDAHGLQHSAEADRRTLLRRLTFDLTGLPPTEAQIEEFLGDARPDAYERLVDQLLASPAYGERWARHWLDVVHYADTHGYDKDKRRDHAYPYRDYVIRALNAGIPYSQFVTEQIAGDVLHPDDPNAVAASGFVATGPWDFVGHVELAEGTVEKEKTRLLDRDDMVANTMSTFVSLTVHCARCHDHKFDPIPTRDYYQLQAVFAGVERGDRPLPSAAAAKRYAWLGSRRDHLRARLVELDERVRSLTAPELAELDARIASARQTLAALARTTSSTASPSNGYHSALHPNAAALAWVQVDLGHVLPIDEMRLVPARPTDFPDAPGFGFPKHFRIETCDEPSFAEPRLVWQESRADALEQPDDPLVVRPRDLRARYVRVVASRLWERTQDFVFALAELEVISEGKNVARSAQVTALDSIEAGRWSTRYLVDGFDSRSARPAEDDALAAKRHAALAELAGSSRQRESALDSLIPDSFRDEQARVQTELAQVEAMLERSVPHEQVYALISGSPRPIYVLKRGDVEQPGDPAEPGALACLSELPSAFGPTSGEGERRAALAAWIVDPRNPLTWRSIANRLWHHHFGCGLVDTPNDFGQNGGRPSHPDLLDWLAVEFRDQGQSWKHLHRLIVTSAAYRQASAHDEVNAASDADNRLLWRQNRRRLEAEEVRDAILAVSGRLHARMYGPGFELFRFKDDHSPTYDHGDRAAVLRTEGHRRAVYRFVVRSVPNPWIECMDGADPNANVPVRNATITALQALVMLNDPFVLQQAEAMAERLQSEARTTEARVELAVTRALGRPPSRAERAPLVELVEESGWVQVCRMLFNLNEFVFVD